MMVYLHVEVDCVIFLHILYIFNISEWSCLTLMHSKTCPGKAVCTKYDIFFFSTSYFGQTFILGEKVEILEM